MCEKQGLKWISEDLPTTKNHYNKYKENTCIDLNNLSRLSYDDINFYKNKCYKIITYKDFIKEGNIKYKIGDRVKVVDAGELYSAYEDFIKENAPQLLNKWVSSRKLPKSGIYEVKAIGKHLSCGRELAIIEQNNKVYIVDFKGLELVKPFTKSDLKDNHIVVQRNADKWVWESQPINACFKLDLTHEINPLRDIVEVYEFDKLIWKREEKPVEILDEVEKRWLKNFIKTTNIKVNRITKEKSNAYTNKEYLLINYNMMDGYNETQTLPYFDKNTMYKGLELDKKYTLEELDL